MQNQSLMSHRQVGAETLQQTLAALVCDLPHRERVTTPAARQTRWIILLILTITGLVVGVQTYLSNQSTALFYQSSFSPAVSIACTGHIDQVSGLAKVDAFL